MPDEAIDDATGSGATIGEASPVAPVLIADNDRAVGGLLADVLARGGVEVGRAFDGCAAAAMARDPRVRVLVCDLDMPGATGHEVIASLADLARPPAVVVVSGYVDADVEDDLRRWPFVRAVLRKPFDVLEFAACVRDLVVESGAAAGVPGAAPRGGPREAESSEKAPRRP